MQQEIRIFQNVINKKTKNSPIVPPVDKMFHADSLFTLFWTPLHIQMVPVAPGEEYLICDIDMTHHDDDIAGPAGVPPHVQG